MHELKKLTLEDWSALQSLSIETYKDTFEGISSDENMAVYLEDAYNPAKLQRELTTEDSEFYFLYEDKELAGYVKLNVNDAQTEKNADNAIEVERIYVRTSHKRRGLGSILMEKALERAEEQSKTTVWLGVWEHNYTAQSFYQKFGFEKAGAHSFFMGDDEQTDYIFAKKML